MCYGTLKYGHGEYKVTNQEFISETYYLYDTI